MNHVTTYSQGSGYVRITRYIEGSCPEYIARTIYLPRGRYNTHLPDMKCVLYLHQRRYIIKAIYPGQDPPIYSSTDMNDDPDCLWLITGCIAKSCPGYIAKTIYLRWGRYNTHLPYGKCVLSPPEEGYSHSYISWTGYPNIF